MTADVGLGRHEAAQFHPPLDADSIVFKRDLRVLQAFDFFHEEFFQLLAADGRRHFPALCPRDPYFLIGQGQERLEVDAVEIAVEVGEGQIASLEVGGMDGNGVDVAEEDFGSRRRLDADIIAVQIERRRQGLAKADFGQLRCIGIGTDQEGCDDDKENHPFFHLELLLC